MRNRFDKKIEGSKAKGSEWMYPLHSCLCLCLLGRYKKVPLPFSVRNSYSLLLILLDFTLELLHSDALARPILPSKAKNKVPPLFKMFIYIYKKDFPKKNIFFFAFKGRPEAIYFAL